MSAMNSWAGVVAAPQPEPAPERTPTPPPSVAPGGRSRKESQRLKARAKDDARQAITSKIHNRDRADQTPYLVHLTKSGDPFLEGKRRGVAERSGVVENKLAHLRFENMLVTKQVEDCELPHVSTDTCKVRAVCFSEATSLACHARQYSPWGVAFTKSFLFNVHEANAVFYCRPKLLDDFKQRYRGQVSFLRYLTPLKPMYADENQIREGTAVYVKKDPRQQDWSEILRQNAYWSGEIVRVYPDKNYDIWTDEGMFKFRSNVVTAAYKAADFTHEREWRTPGPVKFEWENLHCVYVPSVRLLNRLLPDLYQALTDAHVQIVELTPTFEKNDCHHGYECFSPSCTRVHTRDVKLCLPWFRKWEMSQRRCQNDGNGCPYHASDTCKYAHACDGPTCPLDDNCVDTNCPYVHTRDAV